mmetsp:Transcript_28886/g.66313  ORF Transcript_28886/g.66313 Transcript_28886/m.66313 type:complete len:128 (-) Transcript_28886:683-1066(-)
MSRRSILEEVKQKADLASRTNTRFLLPPGLVCMIYSERLNQARSSKQCGAKYNARACVPRPPDASSKASKFGSLILPCPIAVTRLGAWCRARPRVASESTALHWEEQYTPPRRLGCLSCGTPTSAQS